eukprot:TRINITY_DN3007_c0_g1_i2.p1 TRINITY_DN3007_c0_g1~~TRINITY_DN3007_c0_g1_i2.p1  ORF type:complete len:317 (-),score=81.16 TRINITY_DN3007_c0_g1_i2:541-1491(-)
MSAASRGSALESAIWGMFVGDAMSVARHWYYSADVLKQHYPPIEKKDGRCSFTAIDPNLDHPDSWKYFSKIDTSLEPLDVFHDKAKNYGIQGMHYHAGLKPGEPSINAQISALTIQYLMDVADDGGYDLEQYFSGPFAELFLKPRMHNDTYVDGAVRSYFRKFAQNKRSFPPIGDLGVDDPCNSAVVLAIPLILWFHNLSPASIKQITRAHVGVTHKSAVLFRAIDILQSILTDFLESSESELDDLDSKRSRLEEYFRLSLNLSAEVSSVGQEIDPFYKQWLAENSSSNSDSKSADLTELLSQRDEEIFSTLFSLR